MRIHRELFGVRTFDATIRPAGFWCAVVVPPFGFALLLQQISRAESDPAGVMCVVLLSQLLPLAALGWMLCSVAAYSIERSRVVVHRVVGDRVFTVTRAGPEPRVDGRTVVVPVEGGELRLRVADPARCVAELKRVRAT